MGKALQVKTVHNSEGSLVIKKKKKKHGFKQKYNKLPQIVTMLLFALLSSQQVRTQLE